MQPQSSPILSLRRTANLALRSVAFTWLSTECEDNRLTARFYRLARRLPFRFNAAYWPRFCERHWIGGIRMSKLTSISLALGALALGACAHSASKAEYDAALSRAERDYHEAKAKCDAYSGNAQDVCEADAKAQRAKSEADAKAAYEGTSKARYDQRVAAAEADYKTARQRCDDLAGDNKDVCIKEAEAALARAKADAKTAYRSAY